ncbi:50S ribosomal protein L21, mitochondrial, partial [Tanacetum coccineum]
MWSVLLKNGISEEVHRAGRIEDGYWLHIRKEADQSPSTDAEASVVIILNKVLMLGSKTQTMIGRPVLPEAAVYAIMEEHALDAKVIMFKKKRRKNYRRKKGHRQ